jgi:hypothetical protein
MPQIKKNTLLLQLVGSFLITLLFLIACNDSPNGPDEPPPGSRDYTWKVDTLNYPYNINRRIWGSSPSDVWAINSGYSDKTIFHFDGNKWSTDGRPRRISPHSIWGFSKDNVWMGGSAGLIWYYDGNSWSENTVLTQDGNSRIVFANIWGESPNNLYAFGAYPDSIGAYNNSVLAHYTGNNWTMLNTDGLIGIVAQYYKNKSDGNTYVQTYKLGGGVFPDSSLIYEHIEGEYKKIYGSIWTKGQQADISLINGEVYFVLGNEIAKRKNNHFRTIITVDNLDFYQRIWGRNSNDIFLLMTNGLVHYNGSNMEYLIHFDKPRTQIYGAAIFEKEVFFITHESPTSLNLIYHGKIN